MASGPPSCTTKLPSMSVRDQAIDPARDGHERCVTPPPSQAARAQHLLCHAPARVAKHSKPSRGRLPGRAVTHLRGIISPVPVRPRPVRPTGANKGPQAPPA